MADKMLSDNLNKVFNEISSGNDRGEKITLVGATKMVDADTINSAINMGLNVVAENKVQEFRLKHDLILDSCDQQFIGHLQTNKVKYLVGKVSLIQSVDSVHLATEINRVAENRNLIQPVLIEINVGGELSKSGFNVDNAIKEVLYIKDSFPNLAIKGLMAMLPHSDDENLLIELSEKMRGIYDKLKSRGMPFEYLSMGMSNDYKITIRHGSNMIRLGRTIFGERNYGGQNGSI